MFNLINLQMQKEQIVKNIAIVFDAAYRSNLLEMEEIPAVIETKQNIFGLMQSHDQQATLLEENSKTIAELQEENKKLKEENVILKDVSLDKGDVEKANNLNVVTDNDGSDEEEGDEDEEEQATETEEKVANSDVTGSETARPVSSKKIDKIKSIKKFNASAKN